MPLYRIACDTCAHAEDIFRSVANYNDLPSHCGKIMHRAITAPMVISELQPYKSMVTGEMINGRANHRAHLKQHSLVEIGNEQPKQREYRGDHNVKPELIETIKQKLG